MEDNPVSSIDIDYCDNNEGNDCYSLLSKTESNRSVHILHLIQKEKGQKILKKHLRCKNSYK